MGQSSAATILELEDRRFRAMVARDAAALDRLLVDDLHFTHSNGAVEDKAEFIQKLTAGERQYLRYEAARCEVRREGGFSFAFGKAEADIGRAVGTIRTRMAYTAVYRDAPEPRLFAWHSAKSSPA
ncbi:nuclear transport factor 2 family protein [Dankookia sp. P2]|uniref:nuclear transport factor 2 family protein n=1 Tax=Dankookia sp. P2 TaxID=3423955 RepID=UPI003D671A99